MDLLTQVVAMFSILFFKHFVVDFPLQTAYHYQNKGTYGHLGGIHHAALHAVGSLFFLILVLGPSAVLLVLCLAEGVVHYHIDWAKMNLNKALELTPTDDEFWWLLGADQFLHYITYSAMVLIYFRYSA
jgi:hypothetical protein